MTDKLHAVAVRVGEHTDEITGLFKPGAKIAVVVWYPDRPTVDFVLMTPGERLDAPIEVLTRRRDAPDTLYGRTDLPGVLSK